MTIFKRKAMILFFGLMLLGGCSSPNQPPSVKITAPQEGMLQGSEVAFQASAIDPDGNIQSFHWDFGDGTTSEESNPKHTYAQSGEYRVELIVKDGRGASAKDEITIRVQVGPKAIAGMRQAHSADPAILQHLSGETPLMVVFEGTRSLPEPGTKIVGFRWDFGDGDMSTDPIALHVYTQGGQYQPVLTVTDDRGQTSQAQLSIQVTAYEAFEGVLQLKDITVRYRLYDKATKTTPTGPSMIYQYIAEAPRKLKEEEIQAVLKDIIQKAQGRPRVMRITAYLFNKAKRNFMIPGDYDHYMGSAIWDATEPSAASFTVNRAYLLGKAMTVLGYDLRETLLMPDDPECGKPCESYRIALVDLYIQEDEPLCRRLLLNTIQEVARWRLSASYEGFLINFYSKDISQPRAWAIGVRSELKFRDLPLRKLINPPKKWDIQGDGFWVSFGQVPSC